MGLLCDFCGDAITEAGMHRIRPATIVEQTDGGFVPSRLPKGTEDLIRMAEIPRDTWWRQLVEDNSDTDWGLCGSCFIEFDRFLLSGFGNAQSPGTVAGPITMGGRLGQLPPTPTSGPQFIGLQAEGGGEWLIDASQPDIESIAYMLDQLFPNQAHSNAAETQFLKLVPGLDQGKWTEQLDGKFWIDAFKGSTLIHFAVETGCIRVVMEMLEKGVARDVRNLEGQSLLDVANERHSVAQTEGADPQMFEAMVGMLETGERPQNLPPSDIDVEAAEFAWMLISEEFEDREFDLDEVTTLGIQAERAERSLGILESEGVVASAGPGRFVCRLPFGDDSELPLSDAAYFSALLAKPVDVPPEPVPPLPPGWTTLTSIAALLQFAALGSEDPATGVHVANEVTRLTGVAGDNALAAAQMAHSWIDDVLPLGSGPLPLAVLHHVPVVSGLGPTFCETELLPAVTKLGEQFGTLEEINRAPAEFISQVIATFRSQQTQ